MTILVLGGAGYIGSHTCIALLQAGHDLVVVDNFCNSSPESIARVEHITGKKIILIKADIGDQQTLRTVFTNHQFIAVIHFAGLKAVGESVSLPLEYYDTNLVATVNLCRVMQEFVCKTIIFSSSATVYGATKTIPVQENAPLVATSPYGRTKLMIEQLLQDLQVADPTWRVAILRYFNPVGAHESGLIGEDPKDVPNNLMPYVAQVAVKRLPCLRIFGDDYPTSDGTGVRDYIHVVDLAKGHVKALDHVLNNNTVLTVNLGTGIGHSVLEMVAAFEKVSGTTIPYKIVARRKGDLAALYADPAKAKAVLGWQAEFGIDKMCEDAWRWQAAYPDGYNDKKMLTTA